jgi:hypothetical protein
VAGVYRVTRREPFDDAGALLGLLTDEPEVHWSNGELQIQLGWDASRLADVLFELVGDGLAHRQGGFAWASRAATRCRELLA